MDASIAPTTDRVSQFLVAWLCCGASVGFLFWIILSGPGELQQVPVGLRRYIFMLPAGLALSGALCAFLWFIGARGVTAHLGYIFCVAYFGFLKVLGWSFIPWFLIIAACVAFMLTRKNPIEARWSLLLLHAMGTIAGLYMAFHLNDFLQSWEPFREIVRNLWLLVANLI